MERYPPFEQMSEEEAKQFLDQYLSEIPRGITLLRRDMKEAGQPWASVSLDSSPASLVPVWEYFLARLTTAPKSKADLESAPEWVRDTLPKVKPTEETKLRVLWVSFYYGEVLRREFPKARWAVCKRATHRNRPVLVGFKVDDVSPLEIIEGQTWRAIDGRSPTDALLQGLEGWRQRYL